MGPLFLWGSEVLKATFEELCRYHAPLQHSYEVAWALWGAVQFKIRLSDPTAQLVCAVEDDSVAIIAHDAQSQGLMTIAADTVWRRWLTLEQLNLDHWLAAYELAVKGWMLPGDKKDYIADQKFFSCLRDNSVSFYDSSASVFTPSKQKESEVEF